MAWTVRFYYILWRYRGYACDGMWCARNWQDKLYNKAGLVAQICFNHEANRSCWQLDISARFRLVTQSFPKVPLKVLWHFNRVSLESHVTMAAHEAGNKPSQQSFVWQVSLWRWHDEGWFESQERDLTFPCDCLRSDAPGKSYKVRNYLG